MDVRVENKMRTFLHSDKHGNKYKIGVCYGRDKKKSSNHIIILVGFSRIDDFLGSNFGVLANNIYHRILRGLKIKPDSVSWYQYYPGYNGFSDTCEEILMDWDDCSEKYKIFIRKAVPKDKIEELLSQLKLI